MTTTTPPPPAPTPAATPAPPAKLPRVLMVDDEPLILQGYRRTLGRQFDLTLAEGGPAGLAAIAAGPDFAVVVTDMRMPVMDGVTFLAHCRARARDATLVMLTGNADQQTASDAVNKGQIFRFLNKPCPADQLVAALTAGVRQHELVTAERTLLRETVTGTIRLLTDALELADPDSFRHQSVVKGLVGEVCDALGVERDWQLSLAASLCLVGLVTVGRTPAGGDPLTDETLSMAAAVGGRLIGHVPRLASVAAMVRRQRDPGRLPVVIAAPAASRVDADQVGAQVLRFAVDLARTEMGRGGRAASRSVALERLEASGLYDPRLTTAMMDGRGAAAARHFVVRTIPVAELASGMVVEVDVCRPDGTRLLSVGQVVSELATVRLRAAAGQGEIGPTVTIREEVAPPQPAAAA